MDLIKRFMARTKAAIAVYSARLRATARIILRSGLWNGRGS